MDPRSEAISRTIRLTYPIGFDIILKCLTASDFAGPSGAQTVRATDFAAVLPKRKALFDQLGSQPAELTAVQEARLDSRYVLARTTWHFSFVPENSPAQQFDTDSTFLIDTGFPDTEEADFKILLYLPHQDIMQILRDRGILHN
jgi:hypothetical protein